MTKLIRMTALAASVAAITLAATPAAAAATGPAATSRNATATARIVKPLVLTWVQDMNFGTILQSGAGTWSGAVVKVELDNVTRTCANANVVCSGAFSTARYNVTGTNNQRVYITAPNFDLTNANDGTKLTLTVDKGLGYVDLANSGNTGVNFDLGGSISVDSATTGGVYTGDFNVTVDY